MTMDVLVVDDEKIGRDRLQQIIKKIEFMIMRNTPFNKN